MAGELERFLQQAAERLSQQVKKAEQAQRPRPRPSRQQERQMLQPEVVDAEILDSNEELQAAARRRQGPDPLSEIDTRRGLAGEIDLADEKMAAHVHDALDHAESSRLSGAQQAAASSEVERHDADVSPLLDMLRNPETLRQAFIVGEIFNRKF